jgi:FecR protein
MRRAIQDRFSQPPPYSPACLRSFPGDSIVTSHRAWSTLLLLCCLALAGTTRAFAMLPPMPIDDAPVAVDELQGAEQVAQAQPAPTAAPSPSSTAAPSSQPAASDEPIGNVASLTGTATVIRNKDSIALKLKDDIYLNDTVQTSTGASLGVTFSDDTTFNLSANAKITIDTFVYDPAGKQNKGVFDIAKGTVAFVAAAVAKTGDMQITTPTATLGIRGTTGVVDVPEGGAAGGGVNNIKLYPDADGRVGHIDVNDRVSGQRLGSLTQGSSGFAVRPGVGGARATAAPLTISPQEATRDQGIVRQVHATQSVGRQIVTEQRAIRRANPPAANQNRGNQPSRQGGPQQQPGQPKQQPREQKQQPGQPKQQPGQPKQQPGQPKQQGAPKRQGSQQPGQQQGQPGQPARAGQNGGPGQPSRAGQSGQPAQGGQPGQPQRAGERQGGGTTPPQPNATPRQGALPPAPNVQRPGAPRPGGVQRPKPPPQKKEKKKR